MKELLCKILGHKWVHLEAIYEGEFDGKYCEYCDLHKGKYFFAYKESPSDNNQKSV